MTGPTFCCTMCRRGSVNGLALVSFVTIAWLTINSWPVFTSYTATLPGALTPTIRSPALLNSPLNVGRVYSGFSKLDVLNTFVSFGLSEKLITIFWSRTVFSEWTEVSLTCSQSFWKYFRNLFHWNKRDNDLQLLAWYVRRTRELHR